MIRIATRNIFARWARTGNILLIGAALFPWPVQADSPRRDVQLIGLAPLYEALFAVANCPNVRLDEAAFRRAARLYRLTTEDFARDGAFGPEIAALTDDNRIRIQDDRVAFCDARRLRFAIPTGILVDGGPEVPNPLPFPFQR